MHNYIIPHRYKAETRIGNWSEEWELDQINKREIPKQIKKEEDKQNVIKHILTKASMTYSKEGYLHFGSHIMISNQLTQGYIVCNTLDRLVDTDEAYAVTVSPQTNSPVTRSMFVLERFEQDQFSNDVLHYGQKFKLQINPRLFKKRLFLNSGKFQPYKCAKYSKKQEVTVNIKECNESVWVVEHYDPFLRFESLHYPVKANIPLLIKHFSTGQWLATDFIEYKPSLFSPEYEVFCHSYQSIKKTQNLIAEKNGRITVDETLRNQAQENLWQICTAHDHGEEFDENVVLEKATTWEDVVEQIRFQLQQRDGYAVRGMCRLFKELDVKAEGTLDYDDFKWGLRNYGFFLTTDELQLLYEVFDKQKNQQIQYPDFLSYIRGNVSKFRQNLIHQTYEKILKLCEGVMTLEKIAVFYNAKLHPDVLKKAKSEEQVFKEFMEYWNTRLADVPVSQQEFLEYFSVDFFNKEIQLLYYQDISASIDRDDYFENMIRGTWNL